MQNRIKRFILPVALGSTQHGVPAQIPVLPMDENHFNQGLIFAYQEQSGARRTKDVPRGDRAVKGWQQRRHVGYRGAKCVRVKCKECHCGSATTRKRTHLTIIIAAGMFGGIILRFP